MWLLVILDEVAVPISLHSTKENARIAYISFLSRKKKSFYRILMTKLEKVHKIPLLGREPSEVAMAVYEESEELNEDFEAECKYNIIEVEAGGLFYFPIYDKWDMKKLYYSMQMISDGKTGLVKVPE